MQLFLSQPGILSSIGDSLSQHVQTLLEGSDSPLTFSNKHFQENGLQGKCNTLGGHFRLIYPKNITAETINYSGTA
mgnify:CR=1 FL=1